MSRWQSFSSGVGDMIASVHLHGTCARHVVPELKQNGGALDEMPTRSHLQLSLTLGKGA